MPPFPESITGAAMDVINSAGSHAALQVDGANLLKTSPKMGSNFASGTLPSATPVVQAMLGGPVPCSITLKSAAAGRLIELSTDGGTEYFTPLTDTSTGTMQVVVVRAPISHVRFTGTTSDTWSIL